MNTTRKFIFLFLLLLIALVLNLSLGSVILPASWWVDKFSFSTTHSSYDAIMLYRLSKAAMAVLAGSGLALSGLIMQNIFRNPIVGPYVLGLSSGAGLGVGILILGGSVLGIGHLSQISITLASATGSALTLLLIIALYYKLKNPVSLLVAGLMIGIFASALISILSYFTQATALQKYVFWSMGNLGSQHFKSIFLLWGVVLLGIVISIYFIKDLNALLLGENYAASMGVNIHQTHLILIIMTGILAGTVTAFAGPIAFVGLAVPHLTRIYFKTHLHQYLIPGSILTGAIILLLCDTIAQVPGSIISLPINSVTAIFGAPLVIYFIYKK